MYSVLTRRETLQVLFVCCIQLIWTKPQTRSVTPPSDQSGSGIHKPTYGDGTEMEPSNKSKVAFVT